MAGASTVYNLASDMGGMGFIEKNKALCMLSVLINTHLLKAARESGVQRYFYSSSACVYNASKQSVPGVPGLAEDDAYPAMPEDGYGWEKLFSERMCRHFHEDFGLETRVARYHNVYGPTAPTTADGEGAGRDLPEGHRCKAVGRSPHRHLGDGLQTRSFTYIADCLEGTRRLMDSEVRTPINIGSSEMVTINRLVDLVEAIAGVHLVREYDTSAPKGVAGRNSDNSQILASLGWEPSTSLLTGLEATYRWIHDEMMTPAHAPGPGRR